MSDERPPAQPRPIAGSRLTRFATRAGNRLSYEASGPDEGLPVLGFHDLLADRGQLRSLAEAPSGPALRLILPDARGHGASPMIAGLAYPASDLAADALAVLDAEGVQTARVVAIGWGAVTALALAVVAPHRVASLVLAAPYLPLPTLASHDAEHDETGERQLEALREAASAAEKGQLDRALDVYLSARLGPRWRDGLPKSRLGAIRRAAGNLGPLLTGMLTDPFAPAAIAGIAAPLTILLAGDGPDLAGDAAMRVLALLPAPRIERVELESHTGDEDGGEWIPAIARALLDGQASPPSPIAMGEGGRGVRADATMRTDCPNV